MAGVITSCVINVVFCWFYFLVVLKKQSTLERQSTPVGFVLQYGQIKEQIKKQIKKQVQSVGVQRSILIECVS